MASSIRCRRPWRITVSSVADAPIVQNDEFQATQGISFTTGNVLANEAIPTAIRLRSGSSLRQQPAALR